MIVIIIIVEKFYHAANWNWNSFSMNNVLSKDGKYIPLTKLFRNDYYIVTVKLINKIISLA